MAYGKLIVFLIQGFVIGAGPCLFLCAPILLPYLAGTKRTWQEGLKATFIFGLTRLVIYTLMGGIVGYVGFHLFKLFFNRLWGQVLWGVGGVFVIVLGVLIVLGKGLRSPWCQMAQKHTLESSTKSMIFLGIVLGLSPCLPLIVVLTEIMFLAKEFYQGLLYGFAFGIGTVLSPLLLLGALAPVIPAKFFRPEWARRIFNVLCGILLVLLGIYILRRRLF